MDISQLGVTTLPRLLAAEVLLAEPETLQDDVLESCLYILRDRLREKGDDDERAETVDNRDQVIAEETARIVAEAVKPEIDKLATSINRLEQTSKRLADGVERAYAAAGQQARQQQ